MQPPAYVPSADLSAEELNNVGGRSTVRTAAVDAELAAVSATLTAVLANMALNQRDDGEIRDRRVKLPTLASDVTAFLTANPGQLRNAWVTATAYALKDVVSFGLASYICGVAHTSGVFATDLAAGKWTLLALDAQSVVDSFVATRPFGQAITDRGVGNGAQTVYPLTANPGAVDYLSIDLGGVEQDSATDYAWSPLTPLVLTFTSPPPNLVPIRIKYTRSIEMGTSDAGVTVFDPAQSYDAGTIGAYVVNLVASIAASAVTLASSVGASLVGFIQAGAGAVLRSVQDKLRDRKSVLDFMTAAQIADVRANTSLVDVTSAINFAFASGAKRFRLPEGSYRISALLSTPVGVSFCGDGITKTYINQVTANTGAIQTANANRAYQSIGGFTVTGAGIGTATSVGVAIGNASLVHADNYCETFDIEATGFGFGVVASNPVECFFRNIHCHGNDVGFKHVGSSSVPGSNAFNLLDYIECYDNRIDYFCDLGDENQVRRLYPWTNSGVTVLHNVWVRDSSFNHFTDWHVEPLPGSVQTGAEVLFESTAGNVHGDMVGNKIDHCHWWFNGGTKDKLQLGVAGGRPVYSTEVPNCDWMPASGGTYHVNLLNEVASKITAPRLRSTTFSPLGPRDIQVNNPNIATNGSYVGSYFEDSYGSWTPTLFTATPASLGTLTGTARWVRKGKAVKFWLDVVVSAKTGATGAVTIRGMEAISPNGAITVFAPRATGMAIPVTCVIVGLATSYPVVAYLNTTTMFVQFYNTALTALLTDTSFANAMQISLSGEYEVT